jgi:hypothetical protein
MGEDLSSCNFLYSTGMEMSESGEAPSFPFIKTFMSPAYTKIRKGLFPQFKMSRKDSKIAEETDPLNLQPGDWVQVRPIEEISATLDEEGRYHGLYFMPEMKEFCEGRYKVFKIVEIIKLESTGEVRKLKSPTVSLEGVYCKGERHEGCDRACFHFWEEAWLKRIDDVR